MRQELDGTGSPAPGGIRALRGFERRQAGVPLTALRLPVGKLGVSLDSLLPSEFGGRGAVAPHLQGVPLRFWLLHTGSSASRGQWGSLGLG